MTDPLTRDVSADVCVVGAGIAGLTTAYLLAREGRSVVAIDAAHVGAGETAVTTAHLSSVIDATFKEMIRLHGPDGAMLAYDSHSRAIDSIEAICQDEHIDCRFERVDGYLFLGRDQKESVLSQELEAARGVGANVVHCPRAPVAGFQSGPCLLFADQGQFHPFKYLYGMAQAFQRRGGQIYSSTKDLERVSRPQTRGVGAAGISSGLWRRRRAFAAVTSTPYSKRTAVM